MLIRDTDNSSFTGLESPRNRIAGSRTVYPSGLGNLSASDFKDPEYQCLLIPNGSLHAVVAPSNVINLVCPLGENVAY